MQKKFFCKFYKLNLICKKFIKMKKIYIFYFFVFTFFSCETKVDLNEDWQSIPIIYSILNQEDSISYVRINKAFIGDESIYAMAKESDSLIYDPLKVSVKLEEWNNNNLKKTINLDYTYDIKKDTITEYGDFSIFGNEKHIIYFTKEKLNSDNEYRLNIDVDGKKITARTVLINDFVLLKNFESLIKKVSFSGDEFKIEWLSNENARIYDLIIRFKYFEITKTHDTIYKTFEWHDNNWLSRSDALKNDLKMALRISSKNFFNEIIKQIPEKPENIKSRVIKNNDALDFIFISGGDDLNTYIEVNKPSYGLMQDKKDFTNINNGYGLFSCRFTRIIKRKRLNPETISLIINKDETKHLGFKSETTIEN